MPTYNYLIIKANYFQALFAKVCHVSFGNRISVAESET